MYVPWGYRTKRTYVMTLSPGPGRPLIHLLPAEAAENLTYFRVAVN